MYQGTTPTLTFNLSKSTTLDLSTVSKIWVTLRFPPYLKTFEEDRCTVNAKKKTISIVLTQEETLEIPVTTTLASQIRLLMTDGKALATNIVNIDVNAILKGGIIE